MGDRPLAEPGSFHVHRQIPKIAIAFVVGMFGAMAGALLYSNSQQRVLFSPPVTRTSTSENEPPKVALSQNTASSAGSLQKATPSAASSQIPTTAPAIQNVPASLPDLAAANDSSQAKRESSNQESSSSTGTLENAPAVSPSIEMKRTERKNELSVSPITPPLRIPFPASTKPVAPAPVYQAQTAPPETQVDKTLATQSPAQPSAYEAKPVTLNEGTEVFTRIAEPLSSSHNRSGDTFKARLDAPLMAGGVLVAPKDAMVLGVVVNARKSARLHARSELRLSLTNLTTADGKMINITTSSIEEIGAHPGLLREARVATGAAVGAVVGAVRGAAQGIGLNSSYDDRQGARTTSKRDLFIPAGTRLRFALAGPVQIP